MTGRQKFGIILLICLSIPVQVFASTIVNVHKQLPRFDVQHASGAKNSVRLRCDLGENRVKQSRALVLQLQSSFTELSGYEIALTTAHGLLDKAANPLDMCQVLDANGVLQAVEHIAFASDPKAGSASDWALIVYKKSKGQNLVRYSLPDFMTVPAFEVMAIKGLPVKFSTAIGLSFNGQNCVLVSRKTAGFVNAHYNGFLAHDCMSVAGQSGSPISIVRDGVPVVLGMHVGNSFSFGDVSQHKTPRFYGYMRVFDQEFITDVERLITGIEALFVEEREK